jgi:hypothetical protein
MGGPDRFPCSYFHSLLSSPLLFFVREQTVPRCTDDSVFAHYLCTVLRDINIE